MRPLTDLEAAVLGDLKRNQPCTAHFIRTRFKDSPTAQFSDSAGSIYPLMRRLESRGLATSEIRQEGQREVCYYRCSSKGLKSLRNWIGPPIENDVTQNYDPLRTRVMFLRYLTPEQRVRWLDQAEALLREKLLQHKAVTDEQHESDELENEFLMLAHENARQEIQMRIKWLALCRQRLQKRGLL